ncbi:MAG: helix-turn-helix transcriptional regulator [Candidatus Tectomicrobia bacterium]|nr:helix-turn-helix transcriptional regulator [Candidatus Tectomicrobia bacterium]
MLEPDEELGGVTHAADLKIALGVRIHALEEGMKRIREGLSGLGARMKSVGSDLEIIKELLPAEMQSSGNDDDPGVGNNAECRCLFPIDPQFVARSLNLTPKQSLVAATLAEGKTAYSTALALKCKVATIRWHLREINRKLNISRQSQLVRIVLLVAAQRSRETRISGEEEARTTQSPPRQANCEVCNNGIKC